MAQADGDLFSWYKAHAEGLDVKTTTRIPGSARFRVRVAELLAAVLDGPMPDPFRHFDCAKGLSPDRLADQPFGLTNELGWKSSLPDTDIPAIESHYEIQEF